MRRDTKSPTNKANMVGKKVKKFRLWRDMTQEDLSIALELEHVYICRNSIARIESGERTVTDLELYGLSKVLKKPISAFFEQ